MNKYYKLTLAAVCAVAGGTHAADVVNTPEVTVTAPPLVEEIHVDNYSSISAVITGDQLRDENAVDLASALRLTPGVQISRYNPVGAFGGDQGGAVFIRGLGVSRPGSEIKTYVDGVPFYMGVWGHPLLDLLPINGMESITVYKSPQPQINGNNFASINLQTRRATEEGIHGDGRLSAGSFGTVIEQANILGKQGAMDFMLAQGYARSNGDRDGSDGNLQNAMGRLGLQFNEQWRADANFLYVDNEASDPGDDRFPLPPVTPEYKSRAGMFTASVSHQHGDWRGSLRGYYNSGHGNLYDDNRPMVGWGTFLTDFEMSGLRWKEEFSPWRGGTVMAGVDYDRISGEVEGPYTGGKQDMPTFRLTSPYVAINHRFELGGGWTLLPSAGMRFYEHNEYDSETAPHAGVSLISERVTLFANASRGINYPGLEGAALQAAIPFMFAGKSWQNLSAEKLDHSEIGMKLLPTDSTQIDVSLFHDSIKNRYVYDLSFASTTFYSIDGYHNNGAELAVRQRIGDDWVVMGALTWLDPSMDNVPYTPKTAFVAGVNGRVGPLRVALDAQYQDKVWALNQDRNTLNPNTQQVDSFTVVNARVSYPLPKLGEKGEVFLAVENLFDADYEYRPGYPMPGTWGQLGLSASF